VAGWWLGDAQPLANIPLQQVIISNSYRIVADATMDKKIEFLNSTNSAL